MIMFVTAWTQIGNQEVCVEPELVFIRLHGTLSLAEVNQLLSFLERVNGERAPLYLLFDGSGVVALEPAARRRFVEWMKKIEPAAIANFGGGLMQRTLALLMYNALRLVSKQVPPQTYMATESEARAWLAEHRAHRLATGSPR